MPGAETPSTVQLPKNGAYELYEYPARALDTDANERASKLRMQSVEADHEAFSGASTVRDLKPGARLTPFDIADPSNTFETAVIVSITHRASDPSFDTNSGEPSYENSFAALPARLPATPHRSTPRPRIDGSQIAIVAGPPGEEIHTDPYGRVKLWFPWDRRARKDGSDTRWVRVAQPWAGGSWGSQVIPRIGMEAVVSFEGGDPDRPIVTALVPNPQNRVPYDLPANKTRMVMRSNTHKGQGFNELSFEDEVGREEMFVHAQRDRNEKIRNNHTERVDKNWLQSIGQDKGVHVEGNHDEVVAGNMTLSVGRDHVFDLLSSNSIGLWTGIGSAALKIRSLASRIPSAGNWHIHIQNSIVEFVGYVYSRSVGNDFISNVGENEIRTTAGNKTTSVGGNSTKTVNGTKVVQSDSQIDLEAGGASIHLFNDGTIVIDGNRLFIDINGDIEINDKRIDIY